LPSLCLGACIVEDVIPAKAGIHFDLDFRFTREEQGSNCKMDPGFRRDDAASAIV